MGGTERRPWGLTVVVLTAATLSVGLVDAASAVPTPRPRPAIKTAAAEPKAKPIAAHAVPLPRKRPVIARAARAETVAVAQAAPEKVALPPPAAMAPARSSPAVTGHILSTPLLRPSTGPFAVAASRETPAADVATLKRVIEAVRGGRPGDADAAERNLTDPVARKLAEWIILRSDSTNAGYARYATFIAAIRRS